MAPHEPPEWADARVTPKEHDRVIGGSYRDQAEDHGPRPEAIPSHPWPLCPYLPAMGWALLTASLTGAAFGGADALHAAHPVIAAALVPTGTVLMILCVAGSLFLAGEAS